MSLKKIITSAAVSAIAAGSLVSTANARDFDHRGGGSRVEHRDHDGGRFNRWDGDRRNGGWRDTRDYDGGYRHHRNHNGRNIAIGAFAAILGLAIAAEAGRGHGYHNGYDND
jgi:hypothetical protein